jgi:hypothetical protein
LYPLLLLWLGVSKTALTQRKKRILKNSSLKRTQARKELRMLLWWAGWTSSLWLSWVLLHHRRMVMMTIACSRPRA